MGTWQYVEFLVDFLNLMIFFDFVLFKKRGALRTAEN